jgi:hypothetical protein
VGIGGRVRVLRSTPVHGAAVAAKDRHPAQGLWIARHAPDPSGATSHVDAYQLAAARALQLFDLPQVDHGAPPDMGS